MTGKILELMNASTVNPTLILEEVANMNTVDIADAFEELSRDKVIRMFRLLPKDRAADVFSFIDSEYQQIIIKALTDAEAGKIIEALFVDDAVDFLEEMPANVVARILRSVKEETRRTINQFLQYPDDSAGSIMTTEYIYFKESLTVAEAFDVIRRTGLDKETIYTCYVTKRGRYLVGVVSARTLMLSKPDERIGDIMDTNFFTAHTTDDQEEVAGMFRKYGLLSLPVVDREQRLVGIITVDDIVQVIEEETTEDIEKMAALKPAEEEYFKVGVFRQSRNRILWLMILMLSAVITETIITGFEDTLNAHVILAAFIPMLMLTAGNAGCQTSALIIRGLALGDVKTSDIFKSLWLELRVSLLCGLALGAVNFVRIIIMHGGNPEVDVIAVGFTVSLSIVATVIAAKVMGCVLPLAAKKVRIDPAMMAAPLMTTIADAISLVVYFTLAVNILHI